MFIKKQKKSNTAKTSELSIVVEMEPKRDLELIKVMQTLNVI